MSVLPTQPSTLHQETAGQRPGLIPVSRPSIGPIERACVLAALEECRISGGSGVRRFEQNFADRIGVKHAIATTSGTTALHLALATAGLGPGDDVLVPDLTYISTASAARYTGARVILCDVDETGCIDPVEVARLTSARTKASMPVHLYGKLANVRRMPGLVIEDAAEVLGAPNYQLTGFAACFSFFGNKVITTGEGGMVVTNNDGFAEDMRHMRGMATCQVSRRYYHDDIGFNYRMTDLQAALGIAQLDRLPEILSKRRAVCDRYAINLDLHDTIVTASDDAPWLFTFQLEPHIDREAVMARLFERGIETRPTFEPLHRLPPFWIPEGDKLFPRACAFGDRGLSLPTYPELTSVQVDHISGEVLDAIRLGSL
jgi:perosamine synthetase